MSSYVIHALVTKRAELSGDIENTHNALKRMIQELEHLDKTLLMFDPNYQVEAIKPKAFRPPEDWSKRGEMTRRILDILRKAAAPMTTRDIGLQMLADRAMDTSDMKLMRLMRSRCAVALRLQRDKGVVRSIEGPGQYNLWELVR
jgi:hypothetical protein